MVWLLIAVGVVLFVVTLVADYKWRQWMAARKAERDRP